MNNTARKKTVKTIFGAIVCFAAITSHAGVVTFGFEDGPYATPGTPYAPTSGTNNFQLGGFDFSPGCHFDWVTFQASRYPQQGAWLGFDTSGCYAPNGQNIVSAA